MISMRKAALTAAVVAFTVTGALAAPARKFEWTTKSDEAKRLLTELQLNIENFQFGPKNVELAQRIIAADPGFAMGEYYLSAVQPPPDNQAHLDKAVALSKGASEGERRFIEAMVKVRANQGANPQHGVPALEQLAEEYPGERLVQVLLGQIYANTNQPEKARAAFEKRQAIGPRSNRVAAFLANDDLLKGDVKKARAGFEAVERDLPKGAAPFVVRYGLAFAHLYDGNPDAAIAALETYLAEYKDAGLAQGFPEVFIWNSIARIHLEHGRAEVAMRAYEKGYESVPGSTQPEDQKQVWLGRLTHGKARTLAKMGKHEQAWAEAEQVKAMIEKGGEPAKQYWPAYHYLAGYLLLEKGDAAKAVEHLRQANADNDPFHALLLARAYEKSGDKPSAKKTYEQVVASKNNGLERALAYPEARKRLQAL
jgi:tetratricopeptide (TPR) repeat protein